jgi:hypothetical protein
MNIYLTNELPLPTVLVGCWSIQSGIWPAPERNPALHIIDRMGEEHIIPLFGDYSDEEWETSLGISVPEVADEAVDEEVEAEEDDEVEAEEDDEVEAEEDDEDEEEDDEQVETAEEEVVEKEAKDELDGFIPVINRPL